MQTETYTFENQAAADAFFATLHFTRLPVKFQETHASHGYDDDGRKIVTFARKLLGQPEVGVTYSLTEVVNSH